MILLSDFSHKSKRFWAYWISQATPKQLYWDQLKTNRSSKICSNNDTDVSKMNNNEYKVAIDLSYWSELCMFNLCFMQKNIWYHRRLYVGKHVFWELASSHLKIPRWLLMNWALSDYSSLGAPPSAFMPWFCVWW